MVAVEYLKTRIKHFSLEEQHQVYVSIAEEYLYNFLHIPEPREHSSLDRHWLKSDMMQKYYNDA